MLRRNAWNQNFIPWWLLLRWGVSGAIKRRGGTAPFKEVAKHGLLRLGQAVLTGAGRLPFKGIIHVAGINWLWTASETSIRLSVRNAVALAQNNQFTSVAFPAIGAGSGRFGETESLALMRDELSRVSYAGDICLVRFRPAPG